ncbi:hypothetical protein Bra471DRAFT_05421 [Bradyrhizobium sp. WSM471]|nr:hypothetical protein Bra471DRAFT_05421 [Bradyrhizobium sp. WSM471]
MNCALGQYICSVNSKRIVAALLRKTAPKVGMACISGRRSAVSAVLTQN